MHATDGNVATFTWVTPAYNTAAPSYLAIGFASTNVNRIRLWKTPEGGGGENVKNLVIEYTSGTSGPLSSRTWTKVSGLRSGCNGTEQIRATSINAYGYVTGDVHDSPRGHGWASLCFDTVQATGLRIGFSSPSAGLVHYRVGEFEAHFDAGTSGPLRITAASAFPNERTANDPPVHAIDGNVNTFTWSTAAYNTAAPSYLAIGFALAEVNRIRLWKTPEGGGGENAKNLVIEYTSGTSGPLSSRTWTKVSGLRSGFNGTEQIRATSVNAYGYVTGDVHDSPGGHGWASLSFDTVSATGLRIGFSNPSGGLVHYRVGEIQALLDRGGAPPPPPPPVTVAISFCWKSVANQVYQVQVANEATPAAWVDLGSRVTGNGKDRCVPDPAGGQGRAYRLQIIR